MNGSQKHALESAIEAEENKQSASATLAHAEVLRKQAGSKLNAAFNHCEGRVIYKNWLITIDCDGGDPTMIYADPNYPSLAASFDLAERHIKWGGE